MHEDQLSSQMTRLTVKCLNWLRHLVFERKNEDGVIRAMSITLLPEGEGFLGGFGELRGGGRLGAP